MNKDEALSMALEALENHSGNYKLTKDECVKYRAVEDAIKEALAQPEQCTYPNCDYPCMNLPDCKEPEQEPVVWMYQDKSTHEVRFQKHMRDFVDHSKTSEVPLYSEPLANHELQCVCGAVWCGDEMVHLPNKTSLQRTWVGLTDDEFKFIASKYLLSREAGLEYFQEEIESKLREKNT